MPELPLAAVNAAQVAQVSAALKIPEATQRELYAETDARFWAQTGYKVGQKLDPNVPADRPWVAVWQTIYGKVLAEYKAHGFAVPTHKLPAVTQPLAAAASAQAQSDAHVHAAATAPDAATAAAHAQAADAAHAQASQHAAQAAKAQPVSVHPAHVQHASDATLAAAPTAAVDAISGGRLPVAGPDGAHPPSPPARPLSDEERAILANGLATVINATRAPHTTQQVVQQAAQQDAAAGQPQGAAPTAATPRRDPGAPPALDDQGRVKQPDATKPWIALGVVALSLGGITAALQLRSRAGRARPSRRRKSA